MESILVVDDEEIVILATCDMLEHLGYKTLQTTSGREAVEMIGAHADSLKIIILDYKLADISSKEVLNAARSADSTIKVLLATGYSSEDSTTSALVNECDGFLQKPFGLNELKETLPKFI